MRIILSLILVCLTSIAFAQKDSVPRKFQFGTSINMSLTGYYIFTKSYTVLIRKNNHQFELGPKFGMFSGQHDTRNLGVELNYHFYPNGTDKRFSAFFLINADYFNHAEEYKNNNGSFSEHSETVYNYYALNVGYGVNLQIWKGLYLSTQIGTGLLLEDYSYFRTTNDQNYDYTYNYHLSPKPNFVTQVSLGYRF